MLACRYSLHYFGLEETKCYSTAKKKVPFFLIGCIIQAANTSWETQRDRERENKNLNMWQKKNNFLHFLKFYTHTRTLTHVKILYNALIMISSRTDRTLEETVFWDQGALMQRGGVTAGMEQMKWVFSLKLPAAGFLLLLPAKMSQLLLCCVRNRFRWAVMPLVVVAWCYGVRPHFVNTWDSLSLECDTQPSPSDAGTGSSSPAALQKISGAR